MPSAGTSDRDCARAVLAEQRWPQVEDTPPALLARLDRMAERGARARRVRERLNNRRAPARVETADSVALRRAGERDDGEQLAFDEERRALEIPGSSSGRARRQRDFV